MRCIRFDQKKNPSWQNFQDLGEKLAMMHQFVSATNTFGFEEDNFIGLFQQKFVQEVSAKNFG